jgi:cytoskeletal protein CcmA (bactofilin family)
MTSTGTVPNEKTTAQPEITTILADDVDINGTMTFKTSVMIKGTFKGQINSEGLLVVDQKAKVTATITTKVLISHGEIEGDVTAGEQVVLKETAVQTGNITTPSIMMENGAIMNGAFIMKR